MPERLERVEVATPNGLVTITWNARERLLEAMRHEAELAVVIDEFRNAGVSRPVHIRPDLARMVADVIESIGRDSPGDFVALEGGLVELREALVYPRA